MPTSAAFPPVIELSDLDGSNGFVLNGVNEDDESGWSVSGTGDINGDGIADLIIGARDADPNGAKSGASYVVFGQDTASEGDFPAAIELSSLDGTNGFVLNGVNPGDRSGNSVSDAGDINGDGVADLVIGAPTADQNGRYSGASYVVFGRDTASEGDFPAAIELSSLDGTNGFVLNGLSEFNSSGGAVSGAGDINGDGFDDIIIGAIDAGRGGASYVVFGRNTVADGDFPAVIELSDLDGTNGFVLNGVAGDYAGQSVSGAGDINGDGIEDLLIGAGGAYINGQRIGASYVVFGQDTATVGDFPAAIELSTLNGSNGFKLNGAYMYSGTGCSVSGAGDIDGDSIEDMLIGACGADPNGDNSGASYVLFGRDTASEGDFPATIELSDLDGSNGFVLNGMNARDSLGISVGGAGDFNSDGFADLIIGASGVDSNGDYSGASYVVFGRDTAVDGDFPASFEPSALNGSNGFVLNGAAGELSGQSVSGTGDINGDGIADLLIGARWADPNGYRSGASYVVFGGESFTALAQPHVQCPGDVNGDGIADIAVVGPGGETWIKGLDGRLVSQFSLIDINSVVDVETMPNINSNASPELVALGTGSVKAEVWDTLTVERLSVVDFDPALEPLDLELIDDQTSNGVPELANLGQDSVKVQVKDGLTAQTINTVNFDAYVAPIDLEIYPDLNGNGAPELAVLGDNTDPTKGDRIEVRDLDTGNRLHYIWLGRGWQVLQQELIADRNGNGSPEAAVLRVKNGDDAVNVLLRDTKTRQSLGSIGFDRNYPPTKLLTLADVNGNGADEVVVFGQRYNGGNQKAQVKDSKTKRLIKSVFFAKNFVGQDIATCADINGNGAEELVMLGRRASDGKLRAIVKDAKTGERIGVVNF